MNHIDFAAIAEPVAVMLLGEPNRKMSSAKELRFGSKGSLSVDLTEGTYFDHESKEGSGLLDLIARETGKKGIEWLEENHFIQPNCTAADFNNLTLQSATEYVYTDKDGQPLYKVVRKYQDGERRFYQNGFKDGRFAMGKGAMDGVQLVPYRLPDIYSRPDDVIYITEGEKDADRLAAGGLLATTNSGGAGNWKADLNKHFAGRQVVILTDNDDAGEKHGETVAANLAETAKTVRVLHLKEHWLKMPPKGDVSDYLNAGHTIEQLKQLAAKAKLYSLVDADAWLSDAVITDDMLAIKPPDRENLIKGLMPCGVVGIIGSPGGTGKSMVALQMCISVATGISFFGYEIPETGKVLYLSAEDDKDECWRRLYSFINNRKTDEFLNELEPINTELIKQNLLLKSLVGESFLLTSADGGGVAMPTVEADKLAAIANTLEGLKLIVVDTYSRFNGGKENSNEDAAQFIKACERLSKKTGATVLIIAHTRKGGSGGVDDLAGGARFVDSSRWAATLHSYLMDNLDKCEKAGISEREAARHIVFRVVKDNYLGIKNTAIYMERSEIGGTLLEGRDMTKEIHDATKQTKSVTEYDRILPILVNLIRNRNANDDPLTANKLKEYYAGRDGRFGVSDKVLIRILEQAIENGIIIKKPMKPRGDSLHVAADEPNDYLSAKDGE